MHEQIGEHIKWHVPVFGTIHADTVMTTWLVMILVLAFFAWVGASYRSAFTNRRQTVVEALVNYTADMVQNVLGSKGEAFVPFFVAIFVFIFALNQFGMIPFKVLGLPFGGSPTADINTTAAMALLVFGTIQVTAFRGQGFGMFKHLTKPFLPVLPVNVIDEVLRPITLAARLFFNIFIGELLFVVVASIIEAHVSIGVFNLSLAVAIVPLFIQFFNLFVGAVQAFVFTLLAIVYMSLAVADDH